MDWRGAFYTADNSPLSLDNLNLAGALHSS